MAPKGKSKSSDKFSKSDTSGDFSGYSSASSVWRNIDLNLTMHGDPPERGEYVLLVVYNKTVLLSGKWESETELGTDSLPIDISSKTNRNVIVSNPLAFILRITTNKPGKADQDHFFHSDNRAGGTVDLLPLLLGEELIFTTLHLVSKTTGAFYGCQVTVRATSPGMTELTSVPLVLTMISAHCMPPVREGTVYISAIGLTDVYNEVALEFGMSLSTSDAKKVLWGMASGAGHAGNTAYSVPCEDKFIPEDLEIQTTEECPSSYWNAMNRILVDAQKLKERLAAPFLIEVAGVPGVMGKMEIRGRYLGWVDARALLEPGQLDVTVCVQLYFYSEARTNEVGPLLNIPPASAKTTSARDSDLTLDEFGHCSYVVIKFDLTEPLVPKAKFISLYDIIGFPPPEGPATPVNQLESYIKPEEPFIDAKFIRKAGGALVVHDELSNLACSRAVPMNQSIKRSAANLLLIRVRTMLKNFAPGNCSYIEWQDTVTKQHAASRRAVTASFAPLPAPPRLPDRVAAAKCRIFGDERLAQKYISTNLKVDGRHPRPLISKVLRCLEERNDLDAKKYLFDALSNQVNNRYLLWILGAQEYDKGPEEIELAAAAFKISSKGDVSDGTCNAIAWAILHTFYHCIGNNYSAHISARNMRKAFLLPREWNVFMKRWTDTSGEEEVVWNPQDINSDNPLLIAAAFFLCLRCYRFSESLLQCVDNNCVIRGTDSEEQPPTFDVYYLRAVSFILRKDPEPAMEIIDECINKFGPSDLMSQMRVTCLSNIHNWNDQCENALQESERAGATTIPSVLYKAALARFKKEPHLSLQRAARCHQLVPSGHTALLIGRIYARMGDDNLARRWCAAAVKIEPWLSDAWAMLSVLAMQYDKNLEQARTILRTARQVGPISVDIEKELNDVMKIIHVDILPDYLVKNMFCERRNAI